MKRILIQGATGSIGSSALSVLTEQRDRASVAGLAAARRERELLELIERWAPTSVAICHSEDSTSFEQAARRFGVRDIYIGEGAFERQAAETDYDLLLNAVTGSAGVRPTLAALERGKNVALANKETLVAAGELVMSQAKAGGPRVIPIDSEHSAIFQCLIGERIEDVRNLWLTASGGPFWGWTSERLQSVTPEQALAHPTWAMGPKNTIDSATLFNKGLEVIEAVRLFGLPVSKVRVVRQRQSVVHSMVEFADGSYKAQLSVPDMRLPIIYALSYPERWPSTLVVGDPGSYGMLHFDEIGIADFPCLACAIQAIERGGTIPAAVSAADEVAVQAFLTHEIRFDQIADVLAEVMNTSERREVTDVETLLRADKQAREAARAAVVRLKTSRKAAAC